MDTWALVDDARRDLITTLEHLTPEQWDAQSLCTEWRVRDVVAHMIQAAAGMKGLVMGAVRNRFDYNRHFAGEARARGGRPPGELLAAFKATIGGRTKPFVIKTEDMLIDITMHTQDIRRPLGIESGIPSERFTIAADRLKGNIGLGARKRLAGLTLRATDVDWSAGSGPEVRGPGPALFLVMGGRPAGLDDLEGEGKQTLAGRFG